MNLILSPFLSIQENLALEQYYMIQEGDFCIISKNQKCIVIGRNQVIYSEISIKEQQFYSIPVYRRYSGGGAVYLDQEVLNYAFITNYDYLNCTYSFFNNIVIQVLNEIGFKNIVERGCNIYHENFKISGTAQYKRKNRFIHHGTLLINANLQLIESVFLQSDCYKTRAKRSVPAIVENLVNINPTLTLNDFERNFCHSFEKNYFSRSLVLSKKAFDFVSNRKIEFEEKSWTFGNSPNYEFSNEILLSNGAKLNVSFETRKGKVISQNFYGYIPLSRSNFIGLYHSFDDFFPIIFRAIGKNTDVSEINLICYQFFNNEKRA